MSIVFGCPSCGQTYQVGEHLAGRKLRCKKCQGVLAIPTGPTSSPAARPTSASPRQPKPTTPAPLADEPTYGLADAWEESGEHANPAPVESPPRDPARPEEKRSERRRSTDRGDRTARPASRWILLAAGGLFLSLLVVALVIKGRGGANAMVDRAPSGGEVSVTLEEHRRLTNDGLQAVRELASLLREVRDEPTGREFAPRVMMAVGQIASLARVSLTLPPLSAEEEAALGVEFESERRAALLELDREIDRVRAVPGVGDVLIEAISIASRSG